ncbi:MAG: glutamate formimidoyltransferase [Bacteroidales bacterium]|jgi:glutamate formiminotransferase/formiminotetrahydrofolate cyclodeaminase|nr:glutamate formimidoyltransferase [Bacteroidales bacterium]MCK9448242.1 glutamate formimidoyltransferase [Bacteroidales bacterium]MDD3700498.1 glutamate formimidoyltransferase [Bacteroidales bacterium]MDY0369852.1 glutamate formimidoyltransferase [Bacteroidales bacterium]
MKKLIECVPNFSEGRDMRVIKQITDVIEAVEGVELLDVDPGADTNRTVVTFVGTPDEVIEAAFQAVKRASEVIDMRKHSGEHPRMGATDVCPLVPIANISMEETVAYAHKLAERIGNELSIPVYCYEHAASTPERRNLANNRAGEYEGLPEKLADPKWKPDFGPAVFNAKAGATAVGARDFLIAFNVNLNTTSTRRANAIAFDVRERGRPLREGNPLTGKIVKDEKGNPIYVPGSLKEVKAIGWYIEEYGVAQISMNLTNISITPVHIAFNEVCTKAQARGIRVTGSELVGLIPLKAMIDAGKYFLKKQQRSLGVDESELIKIAVKSMGLDELKPFKPDEKIIEYVLAKRSGQKRLIDLSASAFVDKAASESPTPGGGSVAAYIGALGAALGSMVANLSSHKRGWDDRWEEFSVWAEKGQKLKAELLYLVDEDTQAFNRIIEAFGLPKKTKAEQQHRKQQIEEASQYAIKIPMRIMKASLESMDLMEAMAVHGNPNTVSDAAVGALCARTAVMGAYLNVRVNAISIEDRQFAEKVLKEGAVINANAIQREQEILQKAEKVMEQL